MGMVGFCIRVYIAEEFNQQNEKKALKCARYCACVCYGYEIDLEWKIVNQIEL